MIGFEIALSVYAFVAVVNAVALYERSSRNSELIANVFMGIFWPIILPATVLRVLLRRMR